MDKPNNSKKSSITRKKKIKAGNGVIRMRKNNLERDLNTNVCHLCCLSLLLCENNNLKKAKKTQTKPPTLRNQNSAYNIYIVTSFNKYYIFPCN